VFSTTCHPVIGSRKPQFNVCFGVTQPVRRVGLYPGCTPDSKALTAQRAQHCLPPHVLPFVLVDAIAPSADMASARSSMLNMCV